MAADVGGRRLDPELLEDRAVLVDDAAGDLGAADVDAAGQAHDSSSGRSPVVVVPSSSSRSICSTPLARAPAVGCAIIPRDREHQRRRRAGQVGSHLGAGLPDRGHGAADRAPRALRRAGREVLVRGPSATEPAIDPGHASRRRRRARGPSRRARRRAWRPPRRRCPPARRAVGLAHVVHLSAHVLALARRRTSPAARPPSTRAPATRCRASPAGRVRSRRYDATVTTSSSPSRARSTSPRSTNGSAQPQHGARRESG